MMKLDSSRGEHFIHFVGRQKELADLTELVSEPRCRLITLVGVGGIGKTSLGHRLADQVCQEFADGDCRILLQSVETRDRFLSAVADALGISLTGGTSPEEQIIGYLQSREMLVVLDNFEQLRRSADLLSLIVVHTERIKLLVTSREALNLREEWLYWLSGLSVPRSSQIRQLDSYDAVQLFVDRARRVHPNFDLANEATGVVQICQLVEGMPLALELAASWTKTMHCTEIAAEIERSLTFLSSDFNDIVPRHGSMQAVFSQTWGRMPPDEKDLFKRLSVFRGGFDRQAAAKVADASLPLLSALVDRCLIRRDSSGRYQVHELLRQFAAEQLSEVEACASAADHCRYYLQFLAERTAGLVGHIQVATSEEIAAELENIRTAWQYAVDQRMADKLAKGATAYYWVCQYQSHFLEYVNAIERALSVMEEIGDDAQVAQAYVWWGWMLIRIGEFVRAQEVLLRSQCLFEQLNLTPAKSVGSHPTAVLIVLHLIHGRYEEAVAVGEELKRSLLSNDDTYNLATTCYDLISAYGGLGQFEKARESAKLAISACEEVGNDYLKAYCLLEWGKIAMSGRQYPEAKSRFRAALEIREQFNDPEGIALAKMHLGEIALLQEEYVAARQLSEQSLVLYQNLNDQGGLAAAQRDLGQIALCLGNSEEAATYLRRALITADAINYLPLMLSILLDIADLMMENRLSEQACQVLHAVRNHPAATKQQQQVALRKLEDSCEDMNESEPVDPATLVVIVRSILHDVAAQRTGKQQKLVEPLTEREQEVLRLLAKGLSNPEIADELILAVGTVKAHTSRIYRKLQVRNRVAAIEQARVRGLVDR